MITVLIDDDPFALKLLSHQLAQLGCNDRVTFTRAAEALAFIEGDLQTVGLIVCDLQMPDMDGVEVVRHLARIRYAGAVLLLSGEEGRILQTAEKLGCARGLRMVGAVSKPVSQDRLREVLVGYAQPVASAQAPGRKTYAREELARAIASAEMVNHYQPKVEFRSGAFVGVEALVRWQHPQDGLVYPDQFISVAEEHGLIDALTNSVLRNAVRQARRWRDGGLDLHVAVNISVANLADLEFPDALARISAEAGVPLASLVLEVTESRLMEDPLATLEILTRLRLKRIGLSIDDFGTGHSSLAQLRDYPFDELKIDRGFAHGAWRDASLRAIVEASLAMAQQLGMRSVAEGIEDRSDWDFLRSTPCTVAQGYFIARPMAAAALPAWLAEWHARHEDLFETAPA